MPGTVNQKASPRYLQNTNVSFVREKSLFFSNLSLDKSHFITEVQEYARYNKYEIGRIYSFEDYI